MLLGHRTNIMDNIFLSPEKKPSAAFCSMSSNRHVVNRDITGPRSLYKRHGPGISTFNHLSRVQTVSEVKQPSKCFPQLTAKRRETTRFHRHESMNFKDLDYQAQEVLFINKTFILITSIVYNQLLIQLISVEIFKLSCTDVENYCFIQRYP